MQWFHCYLKPFVKGLISVFNKAEFIVCGVESPIPFPYAFNMKNVRQPKVAFYTRAIRKNSVVKL